MIHYLIALVLFSSSVKGLGHESFDTREACEEYLIRWVDVSYPLLLSNSSYNSSDLEVRRRVRRILESRIPKNLPPLSLLSYQLLEWYGYCTTWGEDRSTISTTRPSKYHFLTYIHPDTSSAFYPVIKYYGEKARTQYAWMDWHTTQDGKQATRLMVKDMMRFGVPLPIVHILLNHMRGIEDRILFPPETLQPPRMLTVP